VGTSIRIVEQRDLLACAVWRQKDFAVQHGTVFRFKVDKLRGHQLVRINRVRFPEHVAVAASFAEG
jgi:hypothetical protein